MPASLKLVWEVAGAFTCDAKHRLKGLEALVPMSHQQYQRWQGHFQDGHEVLYRGSVMVIVAPWRSVASKGLLPL